ncbi:MAG TPA: D-glycero-beta-D-manno-heptose-7-phosphate kinase [Deltaproteobacteria bacterium]|nr:D-glycero-beta-D-manno-heptose-7-phosphate kinase [Deltaproteobacteria bacterium]
MKEILKQIKPASILVIGDLMLDHYIIGNASRISPEAPVPVVNIEKEYYRAGGASNVAANLIGIGMHPIAAGIIGKDRWGGRLLSLMKKRHIDCRAVIIDNSHITTSKTRVIAGNQQIVRFDREQTGEQGDSLIDALESKLKQSDRIAAIIVSDYGKGVVTEKLVSQLKKLFPRRIIAVDPKVTNLSYYRGATFLTPNQKEASQMANIVISDKKSLIEAGNRILEETEAQKLVITQGQDGMTIFENGSVKDIKATARYVYDVTGAGDSVIAVMTAAVANGIRFFDACRLANVAGGISVSHPGTYQVLYEDLYNAL